LCSCVHSNGKSSEEKRILTSFNQIQISDIFDVYWHKDSTCFVNIIAGKNSIPYVKTKVENGCLYISDDNKCNWLRKYKVTQIHVYLPGFIYLKLSGSSNFYGQDTLQEENINIDNRADIAIIKLTVHTPTFTCAQSAGTGDTYLYGWAGVAYLWTFGTGYYHAEQLKTDFNYITNKSTGDCSIYATSEVGAHVYSSGNIYVYGHPHKVDVDKQGTGNLILVNE